MKKIGGSAESDSETIPEYTITFQEVNSLYLKK